MVERRSEILPYILYVLVLVAIVAVVVVRLATPITVFDRDQSRRIEALEARVQRLEQGARR